MCDARGNAVVVCSIENLDPMGVHTGDSWTIAPQQTLPDPAYQQLREAAFATARAVGVATGGANVQFAVHPETNEFRVIEMNPRVSRSSALASKATGFPIAKLAALLAVGFTLDELPNDITGKTTAAFEPALDYVAVKAPRFDFEKFPLAERAPRRGDARRRRGARARAHVRRGVREGDGRAARRRAVAFPAERRRAARARRRAGAGALGPAARGGAARARAAGHPPVLRRPAARGRGATTSRLGRPAAARGRLVRRRVRGADAVLLRHATRARTRARAVGPRGRRDRRRAEPDRAGDRVRLLLRPRGAGAAEARLRGGAW